MNHETFKIGFGYISKYLGVQPDQERAAMYWQMLKHLRDEQFNLAIKNVCAEFVPTAACPFPLVAHILKYCGESGDTKAVNAISTLKKALRYGPYQSVCFEDEALHFTVDSFGGWPAICNWTGKEWDINEGRILETYKAAAMMARQAPDHLAGIAEKADGIYRIYILPTSGEKERFLSCSGPAPKLSYNQSAQVADNNARAVSNLLDNLVKGIGSGLSVK